MTLLSLLFLFFLYTCTCNYNQKSDSSPSISRVRKAISGAKLPSVSHETMYKRDLIDL